MSTFTLEKHEGWSVQTDRRGRKHSTSVRLAVSVTRLENSRSVALLSLSLVPAWQEYILHNILVRPAQLHSLHGAGGSFSCGNNTGGDAEEACSGKK